MNYDLRIMNYGYKSNRLFAFLNSYYIIHDSIRQYYYTTKTKSPQNWGDFVILSIDYDRGPSMRSMSSCSMVSLAINSFTISSSRARWPSTTALARFSASNKKLLTSLSM